MSRYLWLQVTPDKYELPVAVSDTAEGLGRIVGVSRHTVIKGVWLFEKGLIKRSIYVRVPDPDCVGGV